MAHTYSGHSENKVGRRRAKMMMKSGGYARGGHDDAAADKKLMKRMMAEHEKEEGEKVEGKKAGGRLDKRARGGAVKAKRASGGAVAKVAKRALGGATGGIHKITPSKRKPHMNVNIINVTRGGGRGRFGRPRVPAPMGPAAGGAPPALPPPASGAAPPAPIPGMGMRFGGAVQKRQVGGPLGGLPPQAAARALQAIAARRGMGRGMGQGMGRSGFGGLPISGIAPAASIASVAPSAPVMPVGGGEAVPGPTTAAPAAIGGGPSVGGSPEASFFGGIPTGAGIAPTGIGGPSGFAQGGKIGQMRKGKDYGEGSGSGRLEEAKHMKGRYP